MAAALYNRKLSESKYSNWIKAGLAVLFTKEGIEPFVYDEIDQFKQNCLADICNNNGLPADTTCSNCCTENLVVCPTNRICNVGRRKCSFHRNSTTQYLPSGCPDKICHNFKNEIQSAHRYYGPSYKNTDATQWCSNPWEVAKCFMPPDGYKDVASVADTDFNGINSVIINYKDFQSKVHDDLSKKGNIFDKGRDIGKAVRHSPTLEVEDTDLQQYFTDLQNLLSDPAYLAANTNAQNARQKLSQLQNDTLVIGKDDVRKVLDDVAKAVQHKIRTEMDEHRKEAEKQKLGLIETTNKTVSAIEGQEKVSISELKKVLKSAIDEIAKMTKESVKAIEEETGKGLKNLTIEGKIASERVKEEVQKIGTVSDAGVKNIAAETDNAVKQIQSSSDGQIKKMETVADNGVKQIASETDNAFKQIQSSSDGQIKKMETVADNGVKQIVSETDNAVKQIQSSSDGQIKKMVTVADDGVKQIASETDKAVKQIQSSSDGQIKKMETVADDGVKQIASETDNAVKEIQSSSDGQIKKMETVADDGVKQIASETDDAFKQIQSSSDGQIKKMETVADDGVEQIASETDNAVKQIQSSSDGQIKKMETVADDGVKQIASETDNAVKEIQSSSDGQIKKMETVADNGVKQIVSETDNAVKHIQSSSDGKIKKMETVADDGVKQIASETDNAVKQIQSSSDGQIKKMETVADDGVKQIASETDNAVKEIQSSSDGQIKKMETVAEDGVKQIASETDDAVKQIQSSSDGQIKKMETVADDGVEQIASETDNAVKQIQSSSDGQIKKMETVADDGVKKIASETDQTILRIQEQLTAANQDSEDDKFNKIKKDFKSDLLAFNQHYHSTIPLSPVFEEHDTLLQGFYVQPDMNSIEVQKTTFSGPAVEVRKPIKSLKDVFYRKSKDCENIYLTSGAGQGKTVFCKYLVLTWCQAHGNHSNESRLCAEEDIRVMKDFEYIFLVSLRDCGKHCEVDDMIARRIVQNLGQNKKYTPEFMQTLLHREKCLVLLDGLDEWSHPVPSVKDGLDEWSHPVPSVKDGLDEWSHPVPSVKDGLDEWSNPVPSVKDGLDEWSHPVPSVPLCEKEQDGLPHRNIRKNCTILTTTRSWKLSVVNPKSSQIDNHIEIGDLGVENSRQLIANAVRKILNQDENAETSSSDRAEVQTKEIEGKISSRSTPEFETNPLLLTYMICLLCDGKSLGRSKCELYANILDFLLHRWKKRDNKITNTVSAENTFDSVLLPAVFRNCCHIRTYEKVLISLGQLAFKTLFSENEERTLVFESSLMDSCLTDEEQKLSLSAGILILNKLPGTLTTRETTVSFSHKTFQEFFAALYIYSKADLNDVKEPMLKKCNSLENILEMSNVFIFLSGICPERLCALSKYLSNVINDDDMMTEYRSEQRLSYIDPQNPAKNLQNMYIACVKESQDAYHEIVYPVLEDIVLDGDRNKGHLQMLQNLIKTNIDNIKSICLSHFESETDTQELIRNLNLEKIHTLESLKLISPIVSEDLTQILAGSVNTLKQVVVCSWMLKSGTVYDCKYSTLLDTSVKSIQNMNYLISLRLLHLKISHHLLESLIAHLKQRTCMKQIVLSDIMCIDHDESSHGFSMDLSQHAQLTTVGLYNLPVVHVEINTSTLEECHTGPLQTSSAVSSLLNCLPDARKLRSFYCYSMRNETDLNTMMAIIPQLVTVTGIAIADTDINNKVLQLHPDNVNIELILMKDTTMSSSSLKQLVQQVQQFQQSVAVVLLGCTVTPAEEYERIKYKIKSSDRFEVVYDGEKEDRFGQKWNGFEFRTIKI